MLIDLAGKTALVSGSTFGIGLAIAQGLSNAGATVTINGLTEQDVAGAIAKVGGRVTGIVADLSTAEGCAMLVAARPSADIFVSSLGIYEPVDFFETDDALWDRHWQVNVMPGVRFARAYLPNMIRVGWGRFILIGSESAFNIPVDMIHYGVTKVADVALARGIAKRLAGTGVTVNSVLPGPTLSQGVAAMLEKERVRTGEPIEDVATEFVVENRPSSIICRASSPEEVANMVVYLASPQASATTGAALRVDGGVLDTLM